MRTAILIACAAFLLLAVFWDGPEPRSQPGVLVPYEPEQDAIETRRQWQFKDSQVTALANFRVRPECCSPNITGGAATPRSLPSTSPSAGASCPTRKFSTACASTGCGAPTPGLPATAVCPPPKRTSSPIPP